MWPNPIEIGRIAHEQGLRHIWRKTGWQFLRLHGVAFMIPALLIPAYDCPGLIAATFAWGLALAYFVIFGRRAYWEGRDFWVDILSEPAGDALRIQPKPGHHLSLGEDLCFAFGPGYTRTFATPMVAEFEKKGDLWMLVIQRYLDEDLTATSDFVLRDRSFAETFRVPRRDLAAVVEFFLRVSRDPSMYRVFWGGVLDEVRGALLARRARRAPNRPRLVEDEDDEDEEYESLASPIPAPAANMTMRAPAANRTGDLPRARPNAASTPTTCPPQRALATSG